MSIHSFSFDGGKILADMGATWFVCYMYYDKIDKNFLKWQDISTYKVRMSKYNHSRSYHKFWLKKIMEMNDKKLNLNKLGVSAIETKRMAKKILEIFVNQEGDF